MNKPSMNKPVLVWQRDDVRIVAVDGEDHGDHQIPATLLVEERIEDCLGKEAWLVVDPGDDPHAFLALVFEVASRNELLPTWVKRLIYDRLQLRPPPTGGAA